MDVGAFVQENKRWLIGCGIGAVAFWIGKVVIGSLYDPTAAGSGTAALIRQQPDQMYAPGLVDELITENEALTAERDRLQHMLAFERGARFSLRPGSDAETVLFEEGRALKKGILDAANERDVLVTDKEVSWPVPISRDEIGRVLFGLELIDEVTQRLFAAHDAVRAADDEATGLRSILRLRTELQKASRRGFRRGGRDEVDLDDLVEQERVLFEFEADAGVITRFFEACRQPGRTLVLEQVTMTQPERITDPVIVKGALVGIAFKQEQK